MIMNEHISRTMFLELLSKWIRRRSFIKSRVVMTGVTRVPECMMTHLHLTETKRDKLCPTDRIELHYDDKDVLSVIFFCGAWTHQKKTFFLFLNQPQNMIVWTRLSENRKRKLEDAQGEVIVKISGRAGNPLELVLRDRQKTCSSVFPVCKNNGAAHARARFLRFKQDNRTTKLPYKESPTMSRIGRSFIHSVLVHYLQGGYT